MNALPEMNDHINILFIVPGRGGSFLTKSWYINKEDTLKQFRVFLHNKYDIIINYSLDKNNNNILEKNNDLFYKCQRSINQEYELGNVPSRFFNRPRFMNKCIDYMCSTLSDNNKSYSIDIFAYSEGVSNILQTIGQYKEYISYKDDKVSNWIKHIGNLVLTSGCTIKSEEDVKFFKQIKSIQKKNKTKISLIETTDYAFGAIGIQGEQLFNEFTLNELGESFVIPNASHNLIDISTGKELTDIHTLILCNILLGYKVNIYSMLSYHLHERSNNSSITSDYLYEHIKTIYNEYKSNKSGNNMEPEIIEESLIDQASIIHDSKYIEEIIQKYYSALEENIINKKMEGWEINTLYNYLVSGIERYNTPKKRKIMKDIISNKLELHETNIPSVINYLVETLAEDADSEVDERMSDEDNTFLNTEISKLTELQKIKIKSNLSKQVDFPPVFYEDEGVRERVLRILEKLKLPIPEEYILARELVLIEDTLNYKSDSTLSERQRIFELSSELQDRIDFEKNNYDNFPDFLYKKETPSIRLRRIAKFLDIESPLPKQITELLKICYKALNNDTMELTSNNEENVLRLSRFVETKRRNSGIPLVLKKNEFLYDDNLKRVDDRLMIVGDINLFKKYYDEEDPGHWEEYWKYGQIATADDLKYKMYTFNGAGIYEELIGTFSDFEDAYKDLAQENWDKSYYINNLKLLQGTWLNDFQGDNFLLEDKEYMDKYFS